MPCFVEFVCRRSAQTFTDFSDTVLCGFTGGSKKGSRLRLLVLFEALPAIGFFGDGLAVVAVFPVILAAVLRRLFGVGRKPCAVAFVLDLCSARRRAILFCAGSNVNRLSANLTYFYR